MKPLILVTSLVMCCSIFYGTKSEESTLPIKTYDQAKAEVQARRSKYLNAYNSANSDQKKIILSQAGKYLDSAVCDILFPYWKGTKWDFNGHTNIPNEGEIACGYLVSTILKHSGLNLNRYKMAQQSALSEIKTISGNNGAHFLGDNYEDALDKLKCYKSGLYILGLSNHVGFIRVKDEKVSFIHSTYLHPTQAINEKAEDSDAFTYSNVYYIGEISNSPQLIKKWLKNDIVNIVFD